MSEKECKCSFCGKSQKEANKMIASPNGEAFICDECIEICKDIVTEYTPKSKFEKILVCRFLSMVLAPLAISMSF